MTLELTLEKLLLIESKWEKEHPDLYTKGMNSYSILLFFQLIHSIYNGIPVAIKFMLCLPGQPAYVHERDISLLMDHPSVITTYGYTTVDSLPFYGFGKCMNLKQVALVMEKADSDLVYYLATVPMSYSQRKHMIVEIGCGLEYLYNQNICNHDLKVRD